MKVPKLEAGGVNWVIYKDRFLWSIDACGLLEHIDGSDREPIRLVKPSYTSKIDVSGNDTGVMVQTPFTADEEKEIKEWKVELKEWKQGEAVVKQQIATTISDSLFMKIRGKGTALEIWESLKGDFQNKSRMVSMDLRRRIQQERCAEKGDVRTHFSKLRTMSEDLAAMGHPLSDDEYYAIILGSLPPIYEPFISALNATASMMGTILAPDNLMQAFSDEFERRSLGKGIKKEENVAFSAVEGGGKKGYKKKKGNCHNCSKSGHYQHECWEEGGGKEGQKPKWKGKAKEGKQEGSSKDKPKGGDSAATAKTETEDAAWMALSLSDSEDDGTSEISYSGTDISLEDLLEIDEELRESMDDTVKGVSVGRAREKENSEESTLAKDDGNTAYTTNFDSAALGKSGLGTSVIDTELFDSGASCHMSGYRH